MNDAVDMARDVTRSTDILARLGGDEFGIVAIESDLTSANALRLRFQYSFAKHQVKASIGMAIKDRAKGMIHACESTDNLMHE